MRWLAEGSSLVWSFVLCLNYFPSLGEEILGLASKTQDRQGIPGGFLFPSHSYSNSKPLLKEWNNFLLSLIFNSAKGGGYLTAGVCLFV